jgi:transcriptional regulator with XRE-family HTH domain
MSRGFSTPIGREFGFELRLRRERCGLRAVELARKLNWAASTLSRVESGLYPISETQATRYLTLCGVEEEELFALLDIRATEQRNPGYWMRPHGMGKLANSLRSLIFHESRASRTTSYEPEVVPGLLQNPQYAAALIRAAGRTGEVFSSLYRARIDRQELLKGSNPLGCLFYIHEQALRLQVGSAQIMHEQLLHLVFSNTRHNVSIRVVPQSAGAESVCDGNFHLFEYTKDHRPVIYLETWAGALFVEDAAFIQCYRELLPRLDSIALSEEQSTLFLASVASEFDRVKGEPDAQLEEEQFQRDT